MIASFPLKEEELQLKEFAKLLAMCAIHASAVYVPTCPRANVPTCQCAKSVPTSHFYVPINVPTWQRRANFSTWSANVPRHANFLTSRANLPKGVSIFQLFFKRIMFFKYLINLYLIYFTYFVYFKYIPNIYFLYEYIFLT